MAWEEIIGGQTFDQDSVAGTAYADETLGFPKILEKIVEHVANAFRGTATDSVLIGTGSKSFTVTNANSQIPAFAVGMPVRIAETADPATNYMQGTITAWTASTGAMTVLVDSVGGTGTISAWTITVGGNTTTASGASPLGVSDGGTGVATLAALYGLDGFRAKNLIINGAHLVDQRSADTRTGLGTALKYLSDRWEYWTGGTVTARWTGSVEASGGINGKSKWLKLLCSTAEASIGANNVSLIHQWIEGQNCQAIIASDGSIAAFAVSLDVIAHADGASSITFPANIGVFVTTVDGTARQYITDIAVAAADTWERVTILVPADATGTITADTGQGLELGFTPMAGSGRNGTAATWETDDSDFNTSSSDNWADATNNYIGFTLAQLELGATATPFVHEDYGVTLAKCERYFERITDDAASWGVPWSGMCTNTTQATGVLSFSTKRTDSSTVTFSNVADFQVVSQAAHDTTNVSAGVPHKKGATLTWTTTSLTAGEGCYIRSDGTTGRYIDIEDEF